MYICSIHKLLAKSTFPKYLIKNHPKQSLRYTLRQNPLKSSISPLFTPSKITILTPKIPSNTYKLRLQSNSTKNPIFNNKKHFTNHIKSNLKISQTPVKSTLLLSNTNQNFTLLSKSKNLSHHKSHNEYNQKTQLSPIQIENI